MLKISAHISKKVPLPNVGYSSQQFGASLEMEVSDSQKPEEIQDRLRRLYAVISRSIDEQIAQVGISPSVPAAAKSEAVAPTSRAATASASTPNGNGARHVTATAAQQRAIHALAKHTGKTVEEVLSPYGVDDPANLSVRKASELIDALKSGQSARG